MFLKSLEIQGFKSFADKVYFSFSPGVTAIVGPNGSGKSNVVDAIRWVLGEQSAKTLRGAKMEDIIFSGSVDRKPVGMARVTMILDNSQRVFSMDCDEIEVSRTLHRSGESQYMLNKSVCRLKDVQELFMDTGLGKDGFSVIGQGKIEEILTLHAEERRGLIEEAAGISKYKYRKREAERKLEATNDDMTRLDDILYELEKRLGPLSKQAEKVRVYRSLKAESDALQLSHLTKQYLEDKASMDTQTQSLQQKKQEALSAQVQLNQSEADITEKKLALEEKRHAMEAVQTAYNDALREAQEHERALGILSERQQHIEKNHANLVQVLETEQIQLQDLQVQTDAAQEAVLANAQTVHDITEEALVAQNTLNDSEQALSQLKCDIDAFQSEQFSVLSKQATINNEMTRLEQSLSGDSARKERLEQRLATLSEQKDGVTLKMAHEEEREGTVQKTAFHVREAVESVQKELQITQQNLKELDEKSRQTAHALMQAKSRLETLEEFESSGEGYFQGVQAVLRAKKEARLSGIQGSVLQLLDIPSEYLTAIENALGGAAQNVVVDSDRDAQQAIGWLKKERRGRVTFMPLNLVKGKRQDINFQDDAVIGLALDVVRFDEKFEPIMAQLLGRVWVLRDLESATQLAKRTGSKYRFVTLDGDVIAPGGTMTGGHLKKQSSIVYRKHEMGVLRTRIEGLASDMRTIDVAQNNE
ncbi:MAG: chromosome segregation protein SMC, partial [Peptococcaceae bacterium]|nr:chromosome segregation protein SMC [Peptococcaceae bacterium]